MKDKKRPIILAVSPCLLDPKVRAKGLSQHPEIKEKILKIAKKYNAMILQMPCPEFLFLGDREPKTYYEYIKIAGFKDHCKKLAENFIANLKDTNIKFHLIVIGIARSPSCSISHVPARSDVTSERASGYDKNNHLTKGEGLFVYFLREKIKAKFIEIDYRDIDASIKRIGMILETIS